MADKLRKAPVQWSDSQTLALIAVWRDNLVELRRTKRNRPVLAKMQAELLRKHNVVHTIQEIRHKMENLKKFYKKEKRRQTSGCSPLKFKFYNDMHIFVGCLPYPGNGLVLESGTPNIQDLAVRDTQVSGDGGTIITYTAPSTSSCCSVDMACDNSFVSEENSDAETFIRSSVRHRAKKRRTGKQNDIISAVRTICESQLSIEADAKDQNVAALKILAEQSSKLDRLVDLQERSVIVQEKMLDLMARFLSK